MESTTKLSFPLCKGEGCRQYTGKVNQKNCLWCQRRIKQRGIKMEIKNNETWLENSRQDLRKLEDLKPGWDGYNAPPIETAAITHASRFLNFLSSIIKENKEYEFSLEVNGTNNGGVRLFITTGLTKNDETDGIQIEFDRHGITFFQFAKSEGKNLSGLYTASLANIFAKLIDD